MKRKVSTPQISLELSSVAQLMRRNFDRRARGHGLSTSNWLVLWQLNREQGLKQADLAERMNLAPITLARHLDKLERDGLVERRHDARDRRCFRLYLTPQAEPVLGLMRQLAEATRGDALAGFSEQEVLQLQTLLGRMRANLGAEENRHE